MMTVYLTILRLMKFITIFTELKREKIAKKTKGLIRKMILLQKKCLPRSQLGF